MKLILLAMCKIDNVFAQSRLFDRTLKLLKRRFEYIIIIVMDRNCCDRLDDAHHLDALLIVHRHEDTEDPRPAQMHGHQIDAGKTLWYVVEIVMYQRIAGYVHSHQPLAVGILEIQHRAHHRWQSKIN